MIIRTWSARAESAGAGEYHRYFEHTLLPELHRLSGFSGAYLLSRDLPGDDAGLVEVTTHTFWESWDAIRAFTGDDVTVSVVEPEARAVLADIDPTAVHRTVLVDDRA